jgi:hypothetical protein
MKSTLTLGLIIKIMKILLILYLITAFISIGIAIARTLNNDDGIKLIAMFCYFILGPIAICVVVGSILGGLTEMIEKINKNE